MPGAATSVSRRRAATAAGRRSNTTAATSPRRGAPPASPSPTPSSARAACVYDDHSRGLILRYKHGDQQQFAPLFARWIGRAAADLVQDADAVVPVPLHPWRLLSRRFNQAAEIARPLAQAARRDYLPDALSRTSHTGSQGGKSRRGRRLNVKKAFAATEAGSRAKASRL